MRTSTLKKRNMERSSTLFIYEHGVCMEKIPDNIAVEGMAMFKAMMEFGKYYNLVSFVRDEFSDMFPFSDSGFDECLDKADKALIIAPENDMILHDLTKKIEKSGTENLGSSSRAIEITSDKWRLYRKLKDKVNMPETSLKELDSKYVVKPRTACGGEGIKFGGSVKNGFIAQEYVKGRNLSISLFVGDDIHILSVNGQILDGFEYRGAVIPEKARKETVDEAINAVSCIKGLKGYVGVDVVEAETPYIIEVNARLTTPFVGFKLAYGMSYADMFVEISKGQKLKIEPERKVMLLKSDGEGYVSYRGHSIVLKTIDDISLQ